MGAKKVSAAEPEQADEPEAGWSAATARPPSSGTIGSRLNRFRKKPVKAIAISRLLSVASPYHQTAAAPRLPTIGPASAICASRQAFCGFSLSRIAAPRNGMKTGALTGSP